MGIFVPGDKSGKEDVNQFNFWMRQQPWYQQWFQSRGLNQDQVKLSKEQRQDLERTIIQSGGAPANAFNDMMIDPAGNLNKEHGFASLPTWAKVAIAAGTAGAGYVAAPALIGAIGGGAGSGAAGTTSAMTLGGASAGAGTAAGTAAGIGTAAAASTPWMSGATLASLGGMGAGLVSNIYSTRAQTSAAERAAQAQLEASRGAGELEAKAAADQLAFLRENEARRQMEWEKTQTLNREQYERMIQLERERFDQTFGLQREQLEKQFGIEQAKIEEEKRRYAELQARLAPYREMGQQAFNGIGRAVTAPATAFVPPRATVGA